MGKEVCLNIETSKGLIVIPFLGLRELDYFTVGYKNSFELVNSLCKILDLSISTFDVIRIYISSDKYKDTRNSSLGYIKYRDDNYNVESVREMFSLYLRQDHRRIRYCDIRYVTTEGMIKFNGGDSISDNEIKLAVNAFLGNNYKKQRDIYFLIKDFGGVRTEKLSDDYLEEYTVNLSKLESKEDDIYQYFVDLSSRGEKELSIAMDELSKTELEDIGRMLSYEKVFDGIDKKDDVVSEDREALEVLTGMSVKSLKKLLSGFCNNERDVHVKHNGLGR